LDDWKRQKVMQILQDNGWITPLEDVRYNKRGAHTWVIVKSVHALFSEKAISEASKRAKIRDEIASLKSS
jgi:hypothetical protein